MSRESIAEGTGGARGRRIWVRVLGALLLAAVVLGVIAETMLRRAIPILRGRVVETLATRFAGRVELGVFDVSLVHGIQVTGGDLRLFAPDAVVALGMTEPVITVDHFSFRTGWMGLFRSPTHVREVQVRGLTIRVPPKEWRRQGKEPQARREQVKVVLDRIVCDDSRLILETLKPGKEPKQFDLRHVVLNAVGEERPWRYRATLVNAIPRGDIQAEGTFGPWQPNDPGSAAVTGQYVFAHADLNTIRGIGGMLHSTGGFRGELDRIEVEGTADVPNFSLDTANRPVPLRTRFRAIVDGTTGDTSLEPVEARLGESAFTCRGAIVNTKGVGHTIDLDVDVPDGRLQDFLRLSVKTDPPVMTSRVRMKTKLHIRPGKESVTQKIGLKGGFALSEIHFSSEQVQDKVDMLSLRAQGEPKAAKPGAADVSSRMRGDFTMADARLRLTGLQYELPGATVLLDGTYSLDGNQFDFSGEVRTKAKLSQMIASRWKSLLLKPVDPFFSKHKAGAVIPVKISGTRSAPKFGLNLF